jgi:hypothetical protein
MYRPLSDKAIGATKAATIAAEEEVDVTASWRDVPKMAYTNIPSMAAYKPTWGGTPAMPAYAIPSGMSNPASAMPATTSPRIVFDEHRGSQLLIGMNCEMAR